MLAALCMVLGASGRSARCAQARAGESRCVALVAKGGVVYTQLVWVTIYTDASFGAQGGGWAVWIKSARGRLVKRGRCPDYVSCSTSAELAAIFAGVHLACRAWPGEVQGILLRSDSQAALHLAEPTVRLSGNPAIRVLQQKLRGVVAEHDLTLDCRWVRGHQSRRSGTSAFLNHACDAQAKKARTVAVRRPRKDGKTRSTGRKTKHLSLR